LVKKFFRSEGSLVIRWAHVVRVEVPVNGTRALKRGPDEREKRVRVREGRRRHVDGRESSRAIAGQWHVSVDDRAANTSLVQNTDRPRRFPVGTRKQKNRTESSGTRFIENVYHRPSSVPFTASYYLQRAGGWLYGGVTIVSSVDRRVRFHDARRPGPRARPRRLRRETRRFQRHRRGRVRTSSSRGRTGGAAAATTARVRRGKRVVPRPRIR